MNHSATMRRLAALENIRKTLSPSCGSKRSREELADLLTNYDSLWSDGGVLLSREERFTRNLELIDTWSHSSLQEKLERYQELFS